MAAALTARSWRPSHPNRIDADLAALWRELAHESPVSRAVLSNLVVVCHRPADASIDLAQPLDVPVEEVARRHPSRVIVLYHDPGETKSCSPLAAGVAVLTFGVPPSRFGVEQIVVRSACAEASLPSVVRRLTLGGVPISIWWTDDLARTRPLDALVTMGRQLIYDSRQWSDFRRGLLALQPIVADQHAPDLADVNWQRLAAVRQALLHAIDSTPGIDRERVVDVSIRHRRGDSALAWLLAGWIETTFALSIDSPAHVEEDARQQDFLTVSVGSLTLTLNAHAAAVRPARDAAPFVVAVPLRNEADAVAAELRSLEPDASLRDSLETLIRRLVTSR